ncbi:hypothetical protein AwDysgo_08120 [Bacteroidales bacterium]|nr:hypothetical protein AwDysgo_08120 [Bacteroidales bacterium]
MSAEKIGLSNLQIIKYKYNYNMNKEQNQGIQIELSDEIAQGTYVNLAIIAHSSSEFVVDFVRIVPSVPKAKVKSRIILTPEHAKRLMFALEENIRKYENQFGEINVLEQQFNPPIIGPIGEA